MTKPLNFKFFNRPTLKVAKELLGASLVRRYRGKLIKAMITEVEAYDGFKDKASHASRGLTKRNFLMFGPAGRWYVYFTYGMHWMLNIVTGPKDYPAAVLIRGVVVAPRQARRISKLVSERDQAYWPSRETTILNGPARLTKFFKIGKKFNNLPADKKTGLWVENSYKLKVNSYKFKVRRAARVGVDYAGPVWAKKKYRFLLIVDKGD